jgi:hypothetical protein
MDAHRPTLVDEIDDEYETIGNHTGALNRRLRQQEIRHRNRRMLLARQLISFDEIADSVTSGFTMLQSGAVIIGQNVVAVGERMYEVGENLTNKIENKTTAIRIQVTDEFEDARDKAFETMNQVGWIVAYSLIGSVCVFFLGIVAIWLLRKAYKRYCCRFCGGDKAPKLSKKLLNSKGAPSEEKPSRKWCSCCRRSEKDTYLPA